MIRYRHMEHYIKLADITAERSKDRSTKVGAVIVSAGGAVISTGYNGFPRDVDDDFPEERHERPAKYLWTEHAERNAIYNAAALGIPLAGSSIVLNFGPCPCADCARAVIQTGIIEVVAPLLKPFPGRGEQWEKNLQVAAEMLLEAGIRIVEWHPDETQTRYRF